MNNVKKTIGWADYTWNPITGCKNSCSYCYARKMHKRFFGGNFSDIILHEDRLVEPSLIQKPSRIFVGSMSDIFYWGELQKKIIFDIVRNNNQHTFMFLSKNPKAYYNLDFPANIMCGLTMERCDDVSKSMALNIFLASSFRPFLSFEPLLGEVLPDAMFKMCQLVIVGAMTGSGAVKVEKKWIESIKKCIPEERLFWKKNIQKYLSTQQQRGQQDVKPTSKK